MGTNSDCKYYIFFEKSGSRELFAGSMCGLGKLHRTVVSEKRVCQLLVRKQVASGNAGARGMHMAPTLRGRRARSKFLI